MAALHKGMAILAVASAVLCVIAAASLTWTPRGSELLDESAASVRAVGDRCLGRNCNMSSKQAQV